MKKLLIVLITFLSFGLLGGNSVDLDNPQMEFILAGWYYNAGEKVDMNHVDPDIKYGDGFFVNDQLAVFVGDYFINFFDLKDRKVIRTLKWEKDPYERVRVYATPKNEGGDLYIITVYELELYEYNYASDTLTKLHQFDEEYKLPQERYRSVVYIKERNSLLYATWDGKHAIHEMSLTNFQNVRLHSGIVPDYVAHENRVYFISDDRHQIMYLSLETMKTGMVWETELRLDGISVISEDLIYIVHESEDTNFKGSHWLENRLLVKKELYKLMQTILSADNTDFRISDQLYQDFQTGSWPE